MSTWYYADAQHQRHGPVEGAELARLLGEGTLRWTSLVWRGGMAQWRPLGDFADEIGPVATSAAATATPVLDTASGRVVAASDSPYAPPAAPLLRTGVVYGGGEVVYAGFWKRVAAYIIDSFVLSIAGYAIQLPLLFGAGAFNVANGGEPSFGPGMMVAVVAAYVLPILMQMVYFAWFHASGNQATLGKMAVGIKVVRDNGAPISFARGVGRFFALIVSGLILAIGYLMAAFTDRKRALHDMMCDTLVVDKWAYTDRPDLQQRNLGTVTIVILALGALFFVGAIVFAAFFAAMIGRMH
jgi:uncharacterized RDD family membrane protein YckC